MDTAAKRAIINKETGGLIKRAAFSRLSASRRAIAANYHAGERTLTRALMEDYPLDAKRRKNVEHAAYRLAKAARQAERAHGGLDDFLYEYGLSSEEGIVLMCLSEALLRIPDSETVDKLIKDKVGGREWQKHLGHSSSLLVNASTWGLMLTGEILELEQETDRDWRRALGRLLTEAGEPVIRTAIRQGMRIIGRQFILGESIGDALNKAEENVAKGYTHSFDMLGEAAVTQDDADAFFDSYAEAIEAIGRWTHEKEAADARRRPGISIKLSALHPRYEFAKADRLKRELLPRAHALCEQARDQGLSVCFDAEEADRLEPMLDVIDALCASDSLKDWEGLGLAVQAYQKRAPALIAHLGELARDHGRRLNVRLVKGAYWDTEIKRAQVGGFDDYPVFTRKTWTDICYLVCARALFDQGEAIYPQFATHNAHSVAAVMNLAGNRRDFEFQRLHGMGQGLYECDESPTVKEDLPCRIYAPVGTHKELLPYLVRRFLENGANTSFVNRLAQEDARLRDIVKDPYDVATGYETAAHPAIPKPEAIYGNARRNAKGVDLSDPLAVRNLKAHMEAGAQQRPDGGPVIGRKHVKGRRRNVLSPADRDFVVGTTADASKKTALAALKRAFNAKEDWAATPARDRAQLLRKAADLMEERMASLMTLCVLEGGKTLPDSVAEVREAVDFLRYYAHLAESRFQDPIDLPGPTGESNTLSLHGRGVFLCISPWNFPAAIFTGQVSAALAAGNTVIAKPASQTTLIAREVVKILHDAGIPTDALHLVPGSGGTIGDLLVSDERIAGIAFTGSTETAWHINERLARRKGPIIPLIAETGGQNALIVDSSALAEQVVMDTVRSAFNSAGQRCSALRILFVQDDVADLMIDKLKGAMDELLVGNPAYLDTDVGPVIDAKAQDTLDAHVRKLSKKEKLLFRAPLGPECRNGTFVAPTAIELKDLSALKGEVFGPVLHIIRYASDRLEAVCEQINKTGYGLTLGIHSRINATVDEIVRNTHVGNTYVNRDMIGAVVGVQPFGGEGLSGTGPKAGGPHYLYRFAVERSLSVNTAAMGGNASLLANLKE